MSGVGINIMHMAGVAPMLAYIGYENYYGRPLDANLAMMLIMLSFLVLVYHAYLYSVKSAVAKETSQSMSISVQTPQ